MSNMLLGRLLLASATLALAACGGGSGSSVRSTPTSPPPATQTCPDGSVIPATQTCPLPPPTPTSPAIFSAVTTNTNFAVLGLEAADRNTSASALARDGFSVRYDAATQSYFMDLPSTGEGRFVTFGTGDTADYWHGFIMGADPNVSVFKPSATNPEIQLAYTSFAVSTGYYTTPFGFTAFGLATPGSGVPVTGTASYDAQVVGATLNDMAPISGDATLQFDFGVGTLSGHFDPVHRWAGVNTSLGRYTFVNTVFGVGSTTFSGSLSHANTSTLGAFDGQFTGPTAQELMARWTAPYQPPGSQQWFEMFGVWVGKRQ